MRKQKKFTKLSLHDKRVIEAYLNIICTDTHGNGCQVLTGPKIK